MAYEVERPPDAEIRRLTRKYRKIRRRTVRWNQRKVDFRRAMQDPRSFGEVVLLIDDGGGRLAVVRKRGSPTDAFDLPTGIIGEWENVEEVARREAREQTGRDVRLDNLVALYRVRVRWKEWNLERWFFVFRCLALPGAGTLPDMAEIEEVKFVRIPEETPTSWSRDEWWGGKWRRRILQDGDVL